MKMLGIVLIVFLSLLELFILFLAARSGRFFTSLLANAAIGILAVIIINILSRFTGVALPLNTYTVSGSLLFGAPAVIFFLFLPFVFI